MKTKIEKVLRYLAAGIFFVALVVNVKVTLNDPLFYTSDTAIATGTASGTGDCCPDVWSWSLLRMVPDENCILRTESINTTCSSSSIYRTYFGANGGIAGKAIVQGAIISMQFGIQTESYTDKTFTSTFTATRVNCPTDGECKNCTQYDPCW